LSPIGVVGLDAGETPAHRSGGALVGWGFGAVVEDDEFAVRVGLMGVAAKRDLEQGRPI